MRPSSPKRAAASARASSVLPTPVGPRKRKLPMGRSGSLMPARARRTARATAVMASSWPTTRSWRCSSSFISRARSSSVSWETGMPVVRETTSAMSSAVTLGACSSAEPAAFSSASVSLIRSRISLARSYSSSATAWSFSRFRAASRSSTSRVSESGVLARSRTRAAAWSIRSMALSGRKRAVMYRSESSAAATTASSVMRTWWWAS